MYKIAATMCLLLISTAAGFAQDIDAAGPDFWAVGGLRDGSSLNVRSGPYASTEIKLQVSEGTILRNLGCRGEGSARWCQVASPDGLAVTGWVAGHYLVESGPPASADALVAGTPYNATGQLPCKLAISPGTSSCTYGVIRAPNGLASIFISLPGDDERLLEFRDGKSVAPPGMAMVSSKTDDMTTVILGDGEETYTIADVVFLGD